MKNYSADGLPPTVHKESSEIAPVPEETDKTLGLPLAGQALAPQAPDLSDASPVTDRGSPMYTKDSRRKTGSILAPPTAKCER